MSFNKQINSFIISILVMVMVLSIFIKPHAGTAVFPSHPGTKVEENDKAVVDLSNVSDGYIMAKYKGSASKVKLQIIKQTTYTYDLSTNGEWDSFPLTEGSGTYNIRIMENIAGNRYSFGLDTSVNATISNSLEPFLISHQRIDFNNNTKFVKEAKKLSQNKRDDLSKVSSVYNWIIKYMKYDYDKARTVRPGYVPNLNQIYSLKKGICYDYASATAAMLRSLGIPTKMVFGYVGKDNEYHAWISVYLKEKGWVNNIIQFKANQYTLMDPTFASGGATDPNKNRYVQKSIY